MAVWAVSVMVAASFKLDQVAMARPYRLYWTIRTIYDLPQDGDPLIIQLFQKLNVRSGSYRLDLKWLPVLKKEGLLLMN